MVPCEHSVNTDISGRLYPSLWVPVPGPFPLPPPYLPSSSSAWCSTSLDVAKVDSGLMILLLMTGIHRHLCHHQQITSLISGLSGQQLKFPILANKMMNTMNEMLFKIVSHTCLNHFLSWMTFDSLGHCIDLNTFQTYNFVFIWFKVNVSFGCY